MPVFQELISRLILDPKAYEAGAAKVKAVSHEAMIAIDELVLKGKEAGAKLGESMKFGELFAPMAALGTAVGLFELGKEAVETSEKFDVLQRRLMGVTHSAERARQIMEFTEKQSGLFGVVGTPEQLDAVAAQLERLHLRTEEWLPMLEGLAAISPEGAAGMTSLAEALALIEQGQGGRAVRELERLGITIKDLEKHGLRFSGVDEATGTRQLLTSPNQALKGIRAAVADVAGPELAAFLNSAEAKAQEAKNALDNAFRTAGDTIRTVLVPAEQAAGEELDNLVSSGKIEHATSAFLGLFGLDSKDLKGGLAEIGDFLTSLPDKVAAVKREFLRWWPAVEEGAKVLAALWVAEKVTAFGTAVVGAFKAIFAAVEAADVAAAMFDGLTGNVAAIAVGAVAAGLAYAYLSDMIKGAADEADRLSHMNPKRSEKWNEVQQQLLKDEQNLRGLETTAELPVAPGEYADQRAERIRKLKSKVEQEKAWLAFWGEAEDEANAMKEYKAGRHGDGSSRPSPLDPQTNYLRQIAQNTAESAKDLRRYALGGGDLGRLGVTRAEMHGMRGGAGSRLVNAIQAYIDEHSTHYSAAMMRQGIY